MKIILARHGNTFGPDETPVWTGSSNDLPLVAKGEDQARAAGNWLKNNHITPARIYISPLKRVRDFAHIAGAQAALNAPFIQDGRLMEIDYGTWTGQTDEWVIQTYGEDALLGWRDHNRFPPVGQWGETNEEVTGRVSDFVTSLDRTADETILIVSSNGILRYILKALSPALYEQTQIKQGVGVKTGHVCEIVINERGPQLLSWNVKP